MPRTRKARKQVVRITLAPHSTLHGKTAEGRAVRFCVMRWAWLYDASGGKARRTMEQVKGEVRLDYSAWEAARKEEARAWVKRNG